jgi:polyvinyl alcohol dehydrogenase (cytochrome)
VDRDNVYVALSDLGWKKVERGGRRTVTGSTLELDPAAGGGLFALSLKTGEIVWKKLVSACQGRGGCSPAQSAAVTAIPGAVLSGSMDGHLRAYSTGDGRVLWDVDTAREYETVNGVKASGGSMDGPGPVVAGGMVYVTSGYGAWGGIPGNALLAFKAE